MAAAADSGGLATALEGTGYLPDEGIATAAFLALRMHRTLFCEDVPDLHVAASDAEVLRQRDLSELTDAEREHLRVLMALLRPDPPTHRPGKPCVAARTAAASRTTRHAAGDAAAGGETAALPRRRAGRRHHRVVLLVDMSGSMAPYSDALVRFAHAVARRMPAEVFTLGTRLTRQLRQRDVERALSRRREPFRTTPVAPGWARRCRPSSTAGGSAG